MAAMLKSKIALSMAVCTECRGSYKNIHSLNHGNANIIFALKDSKNSKKIAKSLFEVTVDVKRIKVSKNKNEEYQGTASIEVHCPKCKQLHIIQDIMSVPKIVFEDIIKCDICGKDMYYQPDEIEIVDSNGIPIVSASGFLYCPDCQSQKEFNNNNKTIIDNPTKDEWIVTSSSPKTCNIL